MNRRPRERTEAAALVLGRRVYLRHVHPGDQAEWIALRVASRAHLEPWDPLPPPGQDLYAASGFRRYLETSDTDHTQRHLIVRREDEAIVGMANLSQIFRGAFDNAVLGYWIGLPFARQGFGAEGVTLCLRRAFGELGLHRVEANIIPRNEASLALARRVGFRREGLSPRYLKIAGVWEDHERFAITAEEMRAARDR